MVAAVENMGWNPCGLLPRPFSGGGGERDVLIDESYLSGRKVNARKRISTRADGLELTADKEEVNDSIESKGQKRKERPCLEHRRSKVEGSIIGKKNMRRSGNRNISKSRTELKTTAIRSI